MVEERYRGEQMIISHVISNIAHQLELRSHQSQVKELNQKTGLTSHRASFLGQFIGMSQGAVSTMAKVIREPAKGLVYILMASQFTGIANARPRHGTDAIAKAFDGCMSAHRPDGFPRDFTEVRCLGEVANNICSGRMPEGGSRYNHKVHHNESNADNRSVCRQLLGRAAGVDTNIQSAHKTPQDIIDDIKGDVLRDASYGEDLRGDAEHIIEKYNLMDEVDGSIVDRMDVLAWVNEHRSTLRYEGLVRPPVISDFRHAADNRYKESADIKDHTTYRQVIRAIENMDMTSYRNAYYRDLADAISEQLRV